MKHIIAAGIALAIVFAVSNAQAADATAGKVKYDATCVACHGAAGVSVAPIYPNVGGQKEAYLVEQLKAFRDGSRKNPIMEPMAKGLSDVDILNISQYLASLKAQ